MRFMRRQGNWGNLKTYCRAWVSFLLAIVFLLAMSASQEYENVALPMVMTEEASALKALPELLVNSCYAALETVRWNGSALENETGRFLQRPGPRKSLGITIRIILVLLPELFLQFFSIWRKDMDGIVPRSLLLVNYMRRADGKKSAMTISQK